MGDTIGMTIIKVPAALRAEIGFSEGVTEGKLECEGPSKEFSFSRE